MCADGPEAPPFLLWQRPPVLIGVFLHEVKLQGINNEQEDMHEGG